jgi:hypothetical protein
MATRKVILDSDIVKLRDVTPDAKGNHPLVAVLFWGDEVTITGKKAGQDVVRLFRRIFDEGTRKYRREAVDCLLPKDVEFRTKPLLKVRFIDVGQGDGAIIESPKGRLVLVDGGEESHVRRYLNAAFSQELVRHPIHCEAIVITHGDADHFAGLTDLALASRHGDGGDPMITAERVFHNGIAKGPGASLGKTSKVGNRKFVVGLHDDIRDVPDGQLNEPFKKWKAALSALRTKAGRKTASRRLVYGDDDAFDFLNDEGIATSVLGPVPETVQGKDALPWLGDAGKTINGHSIVLKMTYGNVRILFGADLNEPSEERLLAKTTQTGISLAAEILKVPHHGSADFSPRMLEAIRPVVSVVSSGDESGAKEYIHPRAGLVGALGKYSRGTVERPLIYVTEMVAFFQRDKGSFRKYTKITYGIVHVRTDGERVLVVTNSGKTDQKEAYAFSVNARGETAFEEKVKPI